jgi:hypothetical protein
MQEFGFVIERAAGRADESGNVRICVRACPELRHPARQDSISNIDFGRKIQSDREFGGFGKRDSTKR